MRTWPPEQVTTTAEASQSSQETCDISPPDVVHLQGKNTILDDAPTALPPTLERVPSTETALPPLNYSLYGRCLSISQFVLYVFIDSLVLPVGLYFVLWYSFGPGNPKYHPLSADTVLTIVTAVIGGTSIWELLKRAWRLGKKDSDCRPVGGSRWTFDWFEWWFVFTWLLIVVEVSVAFVSKNPNKRLLATPLSTVLAVFGTLGIIMEMLRCFSVSTPIRISSMPKGSQFRSSIYPLIEDICAVDGSGNTEFRRNLDRRYAASSVFRAMLQRLGIFWALGAECCAALTLALIFGLDDDLDDYAFTIGWALPFVWAGPWALATALGFGYSILREEGAEERANGLVSIA